MKYDTNHIEHMWFYQFTLIYDYITYVLLVPPDLPCK
jgi:hypothetical protein